MEDWVNNAPLAPHAVAASALASEWAYQERILPGVSRTFALTIPQLPAGLREVVSNAYLLCRIADTVEDEVALDRDAKRDFSRRFAATVRGEAPAAAFARELHPLLSGRTLAAERDLIAHAADVIRITHGFNPAQRAAVERCIGIMTEGMAEFQANKSRAGLRDLPHLDRYCYHVAGVVGELLTTLFCDYSEALAANRARMMTLAVSFGQGLQMTNILKDIWDDASRGACWLPRDLFDAAGFDLAALAPGRYRAEFGTGLATLVGIARRHLENALTYTLLIPRNETGIRRFCLWALGMAVLTLRKIHRRLDFQSGSEVKISRGSVKATIVVTSVAARSDPVLRLLFDALARALPPSRDDYGTLAGGRK